MRSPLRALLLLLACALVIAAAVPAIGAAKTVWLCKPGIANDPCTPSLATTVFSPAGLKLRVEHPVAEKHPAIDCFYVYPTVSGQKTTLANFNVDPVERSIALYQAARYSQYCHVYAPMYRQVTLTALLAGTKETPAQLATPVQDVRNAFRDYLQHYNHGRGFVFIGHSQGSFVLRQVIARDVDPKPAVRRRMLSAILMGGNVLVKRNSDVGGDFKHIRACHRATQLSCVIAFSTFDTPVLPNSLFGISPKASESVLCTNPTALGGGTGSADLISPEQPFYPGSLLATGIKALELTYPVAPTTWFAEPGVARASCSAANNAHVLQITPVAGAQVPKPSPDGTWGLHLLDANMSLGNLLGIVNTETKAFLARR